MIPPTVSSLPVMARLVGILRSAAVPLAGAWGRRTLLAVLLPAWIAPGFAAEAPCPPAAPRAVALPATTAALVAKQAVRIVAFGSSSTEGAGATAPDRAYPARLEALLRARWPGVAVTVANRGAGGQDIDTMLTRLDTEVLPLHPELVIWQAGANDTLRGTDPARFAALLDEGIRRIAAAGGDVVLMDNQVAPRLPPEVSQGVYGAILARAAAERAVSLFSRTALMREWLEGTPADGGTPMIGADGLHHTDRGYACLAAALGEAILAAAGSVPVGVTTAHMAGVTREPAGARRLEAAPADSLRRLAPER